MFRQTDDASLLFPGDVTLNLQMRLSSLAITLGAFLTMFYSCKSPVTHVVLTVIVAVLASYQIFLASCSPHPPLQGTMIGSVLVVSPNNPVPHTALYIWQPTPTTAGNYDWQCPRGMS